MKKLIRIPFIIIACIGVYFSLLLSYRDDITHYSTFYETYGDYQATIQIPYKPSKAEMKQFWKYIKDAQKIYEFSIFNEHTSTQNEDLKVQSRTVYFDVYNQPTPHTIEIGTKIDYRQTYIFKEIQNSTLDTLGNEIIITSNKSLEDFINSFHLGSFKIERLEKTTQDQGDTDYNAFLVSFFLQNIFPFLAILYIVILIIKLMDLVYTQKQIGIQKLHGYSNFYIVFHAYKLDSLYLIIIQFSIALLYFFVCSCKDSIFLNYIKYVLFLYIVQQILLCLIHLIIYKLLSMSNTITILRERLKSSLYLSICALLKIGIVFYLAIFMCNAASSVQTFYHQRTMLSNIYNTIQNKVQIEGFPSNYDISESDINHAINIAMNHDGLLYINADNYHIDEKRRPYIYSAESMSIYANLKQSVSTNENYVKEFSIVDEKGKAINFPSQDRQQHPIVLVPTSLWMQSDIVRVRENTRFQHFTWMKIKDNQKIYSYSINNAVESNGVIKDAIIIIDGFDNIYDYLIPIQKGVSASEGLNNWMRAHKLDVVAIAKLPQTNIDIALSQTNHDLIISLVTLCSTLLAMFLIIYLILYLYLQSKKRLIFILRINGYTIVQRYKNLIVSQLILYGIGFVLMIITALFSSMIALVCIILLDIVVSYYLIHRLEKQRIVDILKNGGKLNNGSHKIKRNI